MAKQTIKSLIDAESPRAPGKIGLSSRIRRLPILALMSLAVLAVYVTAVWYFLRPAQPALWQGLLGLGCTLLALTTYLLFTRRRALSEELLLRVRLAQRSDFGRQLPHLQTKSPRKINLPWLGEISPRFLGGIAVFGLTAVWWYTPLAPIGVKKWVIDDLTIPLGEGIVSAVLVVPDGRVAILAPPIAPTRAKQLARLIKEDAGFYQRGLKAIAEGRHSEARLALNAALNDSDTDTVQVQLARAQNEMYAGMFADAAAIFQAVAKQKTDDAMIQLQAVVARLHIGASDYAEPLLAETIRACQGKSAQKHRELAYGLHVQALLWLVQGKPLGEAETCCARARALAEEASPPPPSLLAANLNNEAVLHFLESKYPGAINRFEESRYSWSNEVGLQHPLVAVSLGNRAALHIVLGAYPKAEESLGRAEDIGRDSLPEDHPLSACLKISRASLQKARGLYAAAQSSAANAAKALEETLGASHPVNVPALAVLATANADLAHYRQSEALIERATDLSRRVWGPRHPFYAQMLGIYAHVDTFQKNYVKAEHACRRAMEILAPTYGKDHLAAAAILNLWGQSEIDRDRPHEARPLLDRALKIREDGFGKDHPDVARTIVNLAALENSPWTFSKCENYYRRAIEIGKKFWGDEHPELARWLRAQATLFTLEAKYAEAAAGFDRALSIEEKILPPEHPDLAATLESYAALLRASTPPDVQRAEAMESRAKSIRAKHDREDRLE